MTAAAKRLKLRYIVITSVTRDDLPDGGAAHFAACIRSLRKTLPRAGLEVLIPDFEGDLDSLRTVLKERPDVLGHNMETVRRLYPLARTGSDYTRSLKVLENSRRSSSGIMVKSGFMVGLGETEDEIRELMRDIRATGCEMLTIGHYLPPTIKNLPLVRPIPPEKFEEYREQALALGFRSVHSGIFVRSSHHAFEQLREARGEKPGKENYEK